MLEGEEMHGEEDLLGVDLNHSLKLPVDRFAGLEELEKCSQ